MHGAKFVMHTQAISLMTTEVGVVTYRDENFWGQPPPSWGKLASQQSWIQPRIAGSPLGMHQIQIFQVQLDLDPNRIQ